MQISHTSKAQQPHVVLVTIGDSNRFKDSEPKPRIGYGGDVG